MPINPEASPFTFAGQALYLNRAVKKALVEELTRVELMSERQKSVRNLNGTKEYFIDTSSGYEFQVSSTCNPGSTVRPIGPDDSLLNSIYLSWEIVQWELEGAPTPASIVEAVLPTYQDHLARWRKYQNHLQLASAGNVSFQKLGELQGENFSFITTTGASMSGMALGTGTSVSATNILIRNFVMEVEYEEPLNAAHSSSRVGRSWSAIVEQRTIVPASQATW